MKTIIFRNGEKKAIKDIAKDYSSHKGTIKKEQFKKNGWTKTNTGEEVMIADPTLQEIYTTLKRGPQIITFKDAGYILLRAGVTKDKKVLELGGGSGFMTCLLGMNAEKVVTYENKPSHYDIINHNLKKMELVNVELKLLDAYTEFNENEMYDIMIVDLPSPSKTELKNLKPGGMIMFYVLNIDQLLEARNRTDIIIEEVSEILKREWKFGQVVRPDNKLIGHTGFLIFARKI